MSDHPGCFAAIPPFARRGYPHDYITLTVQKSRDSSTLNRTGKNFSITSWFVFACLEIFIAVHSRDQRQYRRECAN